MEGRLDVVEHLVLARFRTHLRENIHLFQVAFKLSDGVHDCAGHLHLCYKSLTFGWIVPEIRIVLSLFNLLEAG